MTPDEALWTCARRQVRGMGLVIRGLGTLKENMKFDPALMGHLRGEGPRPPIDAPDLTADAAYTAGVKPRVLRELLAATVDAALAIVLDPVRPRPAAVGPLGLLRMTRILDGRRALAFHTSRTLAPGAAAAAPIPAAQVDETLRLWRRPAPARDELPESVHRFLVIEGERASLIPGGQLAERADAPLDVVLRGHAVGRALAMLPGVLAPAEQQRVIDTIAANIHPEAWPVLELVLLRVMPF